MKVKILVPEFRTAEGVVAGGETVELSDKEARRLIQRGYAAEVGADQPEAKGKTPANKAKTPENKEA